MPPLFVGKYPERRDAHWASAIFLRFDRPAGYAAFVCGKKDKKAAEHNLCGFVLSYALSGICRRIGRTSSGVGSRCRFDAWSRIRSDPRIRSNTGIGSNTRIRSNSRIRSYAGVGIHAGIRVSSRSSSLVGIRSISGIIACTAAVGIVGLSCALCSTGVGIGSIAGIGDSIGIHSSCLCLIVAGHDSCGDTSVPEES